jgi:hypothetical protein
MVRETRKTFSRFEPGRFQKVSERDGLPGASEERERMEWERENGME